MKRAAAAAVAAVVLAATAARAAAPDERVWKDKLGLSDSQLQRYSSAEKAKEDAVRPLRGQLRDALQKVQTQLQAGAPEGDVQESLDRLLQVRESIQAVNKKFDSDLASFLSPSQRAKLLVGVPLGGARTAAAPRLDADPREGYGAGAEDPE